MNVKINEVSKDLQDLPFPALYRVKESDIVLLVSQQEIDTEDDDDFEYEGIIIDCKESYKIGTSWSKMVNPDDIDLYYRLEPGSKVILTQE